MKSLKYLLVGLVLGCVQPIDPEVLYDIKSLNGDVEMRRVCYFDNTTLKTVDANFQFVTKAFSDSGYVVVSPTKDMENCIIILGNKRK